jgi:hypothetical protein
VRQDRGTLQADLTAVQAVLSDVESDTMRQLLQLKSSSKCAARPTRLMRGADCVRYVDRVAARLDQQLQAARKQAALAASLAERRTAALETVRALCPCAWLLT